MTQQSNNPQINEIVSRLINAYKPAEIYLFGSHVWGEPNEYSDIDFFVVVSESEQDPAERIRVGLRELKDVHAAVDILVYTAREVAERKDHPSTLAHKVLSKGVKLYEAA